MNNYYLTHIKFINIYYFKIFCKVYYYNYWILYYEKYKKKVKKLNEREFGNLKILNIRTLIINKMYMNIILIKSLTSGCNFKLRGCSFKHLKCILVVVKM